MNSDVLLIKLTETTCSKSQPFDRPSHLPKTGSVQRCRRWVAAFWFSHPPKSFRNNNKNQSLHFKAVPGRPTLPAPSKRSSKADGCVMVPVSEVPQEEGASSRAPRYAADPPRHPPHREEGAREGAARHSPGIPCSTYTTGAASASNLHRALGGCRSQPCAERVSRLKEVCQPSPAPGKRAGEAA